MQGFPKWLNCRRDVDNCMVDYPEETKRYLRNLVDNRYCLVSREELPEGQEGKNEPPFYVSYEMTSSDKEGKVLSRTVVQQVWKEDENSALVRLGFSVKEAEDIISGVLASASQLKAVNDE
jgi:hypothetical protein